MTTESQIYEYIVWPTVFRERGTYECCVVGATSPVQAARAWARERYDVCKYLTETHEPACRVTRADGSGDVFAFDTMTRVTAKLRTSVPSTG